MKTYSMVIQWAKMNWGIIEGWFYWDDDGFIASFATPLQKLAAGPCQENSINSRRVKD